MVGSSSGFGSTGDDRGQSNLLGLVLILGITAVGMAVILMFGMSALADSQSATEVNRAEHSMTELDSKISLTALGSSDRQQPSISLDGGESQLSMRDDVGWMNVTIRNESNGPVRMNIMNKTLGALVYENAHKDVTIAYQAGGVWRKSAQGTVMVSPPEFHYRTDGADPTLTLPLIVLRGTGSVGGDIVAEKTGTTVSKYPISGVGAKTNPLTEGQVNITIHSDYYRSWGTFFEERTDGRVSYNHDKKLALITLVVPTSDTDQTVTSAISATRPGGTLRVAGTGGYLDSYNSSNGSYGSQTPGSDGNITYGGDIEVSGNADILGNLKSGSEVRLSSSAMSMDGEIYHTSGYSDTHGHADGYTEIDGVDDVPAIDSIVSDNVTDIKASNDNTSASSTIDNIETGNCGSGCELTAGRYYLEQIDLSKGDELELDTSSGDITIALEDSIHLPDSGGSTTRMSVTGSGVVRFYVKGEDGTNQACNYVECHLAIGQNSVIEIPDDRSTKLRIYGKKDFKTTIAGSGSNHAVFTGVVYAPTGTGGSGEAYFKHAHVYGAIVSGSALVHNKAHLHYDQALRSETIVPSTDPSDEVARITYLHISVNEVTIRSR